MCVPVENGTRALVDSILVIVARFTKLTHLFPVNTEITSIELVALFYQKIECIYGSPTGKRHSVAFYPRTNGQAERMNQTIESYLRCFVNNKQTNWPQLLLKPISQLTQLLIV